MKATLMQGDFEGQSFLFVVWLWDFGVGKKSKSKKTKKMMEKEERNEIMKKKGEGNIMMCESFLICESIM